MTNKYTAADRSKIMAKISALRKDGDTVPVALQKTGLSAATYYAWNNGRNAASERRAAKAKDTNVVPITIRAGELTFTLTGTAATRVLAFVTDTLKGF